MGVRSSCPRSVAWVQKKTEREMILKPRGATAGDKTCRVALSHCTASIRGCPMPEGSNRWSHH